MVDERRVDESTIEHSRGRQNTVECRAVQFNAGEGSRVRGRSDWIVSHRSIIKKVESI